jgi:hypothetical protein
MSWEITFEGLQVDVKHNGIPVACRSLEIKAEVGQLSTMKIEMVAMGSEGFKTHWVEETKPAPGID